MSDVPGEPQPISNEDAIAEETGDRLSKSYSLDELRKLNKRTKS